MANAGKVLLLVAGIALIVVGIVAAVYSAILFQQNVQNLKELRGLITR